MGKQANKTAMMVRAETRLGKPLEEALPEAYEKYRSLDAAATALGIKVNTMYVWMMRLGITIKKTVAS